MKTWTMAMGTNCTYLVHDGYHKAKSTGTDIQNNCWMNDIASKLNAVEGIPDPEVTIPALVEALNRISKMLPDSPSAGNVAQEVLSKLNPSDT